MPELNVIRPADANECAQAWRFHIDGEHPTAIVLTRQSVPVLAGTAERSPEGLPRGAYVLVDEADGLDIVLIGTGSEVSLCVDARDAARRRRALGACRVVPVAGSCSRRKTTPTAIRCSRPGVPTLAVEAGASFGWERYADDVVAIDHFGASAPGGTAMKEFGFTPENVAARARALLQTGGTR